MAGEGTLSLQPQCSLHTENVKLETRVIFGNKSELVIPKLDLRAWDDINLDSKMESEMNLTTNEADKIAKLKGDIEVIRKNQILIKPKTIELHDVHHYSLIYLLVITIIVYILVKKCYMKPIANQNSGNILPAISMPNLAGENVATDN